MNFKYSCIFVFSVELLFLTRSELSAKTNSRLTKSSDIIEYDNRKSLFNHKFVQRKGSISSSAPELSSFDFYPIIEKRIQDRKVCPVGHFECKVNYLLCVPQAAICNGKPECADGSDEENCQDPHLKGEWDWVFVKRPDEDAEKHNGTCEYPPPHNHPFEIGSSMDFVLDIASTLKPHRKSETAGVPFVNKLGIEIGRWTKDLLNVDDVQMKYIRSSRNTRSSSSSSSSSSSVLDEITEIDTYWLTKGCLCGGEKLFCQNLQLDNLNFLPINVEFLDLSGSRVENMDFTSPAFPNLRTLVLSGCYVEDIVPGAFNQLHSLEVLYLTNNRLRYIPIKVFSKESPIHRLFLDYNQISVLQPESFEGLPSLLELNLRHNLLTGREIDVFKPLKSLLILHLNNNKIEYIRNKFLRGLSNLKTLTLTNNMIRYIEAGTFENMVSLKQLYLNWNKLRVLQDMGFCHLRSLLTLNLRGNDISIIEAGAFTCLDSLTSLNMGRNKFGEIAQASRIFENLTSLEYIYFDHFWMCSWAHHVRSCMPKGDGISSVKNLLDSVVLRVCVWIMGLLSIFGNCFVIFCRIIVREPNRVHSFYIRNLAAADLLMGCFLLTIATHDLSFRGEFLAYQEKWRHSLTCQLSGLLSTWSSEASVFILTLITADRYRSIVRPFKEKTTSLNVALGICTFLWIISFLLSYIPLSGLFNNYFKGNFYTQNGLCLPLHLDNPWGVGWGFSLFLFCGLNSLAFACISYAYWKIFKVIKISTTSVRSTQQRQDGMLAKRFGLVVLTDFLCWFPVIISKTLAMSGVSIPSELYAWLAVFALPVNSALNPIIYTLTTKTFKLQIVKMTRSFRNRLMRRAGHSEESTTASLSLFRYRTQRTGNTSLTHSVKVNRDKIGIDTTNTNSARSIIQLKIIVPPQSQTLSNHVTSITNTTANKISTTRTDSSDSNFFGENVCQLDVSNKTRSEVTSEI